MGPGGPPPAGFAGQPGGFPPHMGGPGGPPPAGGPQQPPWGAPGPNDPGGGPHQQYYPGPQQPHQPRKKRSGCGCGCAAFAVIVLVVLALTYLQVWGVYDWVYEIFGVGSPRQFVWD